MRLLPSILLSGLAAQAFASPNLAPQDFAPAVQNYATLADLKSDFEDLGVFTRDEANAIETSLKESGIKNSAKLPPTHAQENVITNGTHKFTLQPDGSFKTEAGRVLKFSEATPADKVFAQTFAVLHAKTSVMNLVIPRANAAAADELSGAASASLVLAAFTGVARAAGNASCDVFNRVGLTWGKLYGKSVVAFQNADLACTADGRFVVHTRDKAFARALASYDKIKTTTGPCSRVSAAWKLWHETFTTTPDTTGDLEVNPAMIKAYFEPKPVGICTYQNVEDVKLLVRSKASSVRQAIRAFHEKDSDSGLEWEQSMKRSGKEIR